MSPAIFLSRFNRSYAAIFFSALLTSCGGGGGEGAGVIIPTETPQPTTLENNSAGTDDSGVLLSDARFNNPVGITTLNGELYIADSGNHTIRKITSSGSVITLAGVAGIQGSANGARTAARFNGPQGIAVDSSGNLFIADTGNQTIRKITPNGTVTTLAGSAGIKGNANGSGPAAQFNRPSGIAADAGGNLYVTDTENYLIRKITSTGSVSTLAGRTDQRGRTNGDVSVATFINPLAIAIDVMGSLYVSDGYFYPPEPNTIAEVAIIRKVTQAGVVSTLAGDFSEGPRDTNGSGTDARFNRSTGLTVAADGNLYVADTNNNLIRKVTPDAMVTTFVGTAAGLSRPQGIASDASGNLYIADTANHVIRKIGPDGTVTTYAGKVGESGSN